MEIKSRDDFYEFLTLLRDDLHKRPDGWENNNLDAFLEAMAAYTKDIGYMYRNNNIDIDVDVSNPPWRVFADILLGAKIYE